MFADCSEISISVIVKHVQHGGIIIAFLSAWGDLLSFPAPWGREKISTHADTML